MQTTKPTVCPLILVVDDQETQRLLMTAALRQGGFDVLEADCGADALKLFDTNDVSAILLDVMMPGMDGFEVCRQIRRSSAGRHIPIMVMTARNDEDAIKEAYDVGATDFISKPVNALILNHRMRYMLRAASTSEELRSSETLLRIAEEVALSGSWEWSYAQNTLRFSEGFARLFGLSAPNGLPKVEQFYRCYPRNVGDDLRDLMRDPTGRELPLSLEHSSNWSYGTLRHFETRIDRRTDLAGQAVLCGFTQEVTKRREAEGEIRKLAYFDSLTGLPNRVLFTEHLKHLLAGAARNDEQFAILHIDIDDFKRVNELGDRATGDRILGQIAERIGDTLRASDVVSRAPAENLTELGLARLGGDEFIVAVRGIEGRWQVEAVCNRVLESLGEPYALDDRCYRLSASIGVSIFPEHGRDIEGLLLNADSAMSEAKKCGKNRYKVFSDGLRKRVLERISIANNLRGALENRELDVFYQPRINIHLNQVVGMEALVRWKHGENFISPTQFVPIAEESDLIGALGAFVLQRACQQGVACEAHGFPELEVGVNVSARQLEQPTFPEQVQSAIAESGISPASLCLELTESALMENADRNVEVLGALRKLGCKIAVDDFGTGYSSLNYLKRFPIDTLKIDRSFVIDLESSHDDGTIVTAVIRLAQTLGLTVVAEGVEKQSQENVLRKLGCDEVQGYLYSRPLPSAGFEAWLHDRLAVSKVLRAIP